MQIIRKIRKQERIYTSEYIEIFYILEIAVRRNSQLSNTEFITIIYIIFYIFINTNYKYYF